MEKTFKLTAKTKFDNEGNYLVTYKGKNVPDIIKNLYEDKDINYTIYSWINIVAYIASYASEYAKGTKIEDLLKNQSRDIENLIDRAVIRMESIIHTQLDEATIQRCQARINGCFLDLIEFEQSPTTFYRLEHAITSSTEAVNEIKSIGWVQYEAVSDAASIRILALCVNAKATQVKGEFANLVNYINDCSLTLEQFIADAKEYCQNLINNITNIQYKKISSGIRARGKDGPIFSFYEVEGFFYDNGEIVKLKIEKEDKESAQKEVFNKLNPMREQRLASRTQKRDQVELQMRQGLAIRSAEWSKCIALAEKFFYKEVL